MKTRFVLLIVVLLMGCLSCDKSDDSIDTKLEAVVDGKKWVSLPPLVNFNSSTGILSIVAISVDGRSLNIVIKGAEEKTYTLDFLNKKLECDITYKYTPTVSLDDLQLGVKGTVKITKIDKSSKRVSGEFNFSTIKSKERKILEVLEGKNLTQITNGVFENLSYIQN